MFAGSPCELRQAVHFACVRLSVRTEFSICCWVHPHHGVSIRGLRYPGSPYPLLMLGRLLQTQGQSSPPPTCSPSQTLTPQLAHLALTCAPRIWDPVPVQMTRTVTLLCRERPSRDALVTDGGTPVGGSHHVHAQSAARPVTCAEA